MCVHSFRINVESRSSKSMLLMLKTRVRLIWKIHHFNSFRKFIRNNNNKNKDNNFKLRRTKTFSQSHLIASYLAHTLVQRVFLCVFIENLKRFTNCCVRRKLFVLISHITYTVQYRYCSVASQWKPSARSAFFPPYYSLFFFFFF